jgi:hypothetical protein
MTFSLAGFSIHVNVMLPVLLVWLVRTRNVVIADGVGSTGGPELYHGTHTPPRFAQPLAAPRHVPPTLPNGCCIVRHVPPFLTLPGMG